MLGLINSNSRVNEGKISSHLSVAVHYEEVTPKTTISRYVSRRVLTLAVQNSCLEIFNTCSQYYFQVYRHGLDLENDY